MKERIKSFTHALRGIKILLGERNAKIQVAVAILAVALGIYCRISSTEWAIIAFSIALVLALEAVNTALEVDMNLTSPEYHPAARDVKDVAAGAVLIAAIGAAGIALFIFLPKLW